MKNLIIAVVIFLSAAFGLYSPPIKDYGPADGGGGGYGQVTQSVRVGGVGKAKPTWSQAVRAISRQVKGKVVTRGEVYRAADGSWQVRVVQRTR